MRQGHYFVSEHREGINVLMGTSVCVFSQQSLKGARVCPSTVLFSSLRGTLLGLSINVYWMTVLCLCSKVNIET